MSLKLLLNLLITALLALLMLVGTWMLIHNARTQVLAEVDSTSALATHLLDAEAIYFSGITPGEPYHKPFRLQGLEHLRHLRIEYRDTAGRLLDTNMKTSANGSVEAPPKWFVQAMTVALPKQVAVRRPLIVNGRDMGELIVTPDPSYEVAEIWRDTVDLFLLVAVFFVSVNLMVFWAVGRALSPVDRILLALTDLEKGNLDARLPTFKLPELASISHKFNVMAQTLQQSIGRNHKLSRQLLQLQEDERKSLARDLHDELGQYLTAIRTDATTLLEMSKTQFPAAQQGAQAIVDVSTQVMSIIRTMLQRLRPDVLDEFGLQPALAELLEIWRQRSSIDASLNCSPQNLPKLHESVNLTAYRVVQECLTNISKHANAQRVEIFVRVINSDAYNPQLEVTVNDDGKGFDPMKVDGFGLNGMKERVEGAGGDLKIQSSPTHGTKVVVRLPINHVVENV
jgi:two-component system sensor histidine kinase UhpB